MLKSRRLKAFGRTKHAPNLPVKFMQDQIDGDLSPAITSPPLKYASEVGIFVKPETLKDIQE